MTNYTPRTERVRRRFERSQRIHASPETVFPLLCPVREYEWIPGWDCRMVYTESGLAEAGCIFQTSREAEGGLDTWLVSRYHPNRHIAFVRINHLRAMQYDIQVERLAEHASELTWTQIVTALNDAGDRHVAALQEEDFARTISKLERLLNEHVGKRSISQHQNETT